MAKFKTIVMIAAIGVFAGAAMSNGMMDVARHGIMTPEYFSFYEVMCVFLAVMVTDVILLDIFNTLGMPTSTTVIMGIFLSVAIAFVVGMVVMWVSRMISSDRKRALDSMQDGTANLNTLLLTIHILQESQELIGCLRHMIRGMNKFAGMSILEWIRQ